MEYVVGDILELEIEKLVYEGYGLAHISGKEGFVCFVDDVCDGDFAEVKITKVKKNCLFAKPIKIIKPSKYRVQPFCHLHNACGGCLWQFIDYEHQLSIKQNIVEETLSKVLGKNIDVEKIVSSPQIKEYRYKVQMPVEQTKNSKRFLIGYYKRASHEIVNIKHCPIQPKFIDDITEKIRILAYEAGVCAYNEVKHRGELRHVIYRISKDNSGVIICFVVNSDKVSEPVKRLAKDIYTEFEAVKGVSVNFNTNKNNVILGKKTVTLNGCATYLEKIGGISYVISPDSFFQVNPDSFKNIMDKVRELILERIGDSKPTILDAYSGVGSFGLYLSDIASKITCVEEVKTACENNKKACKINNIDNLEVINDDAQKVFEKFISSGKKFDVVILDPPRKGCTKQSVEFASRLTDKYIVYVSCNPNSLARDIKLFEQYGFELSFIQPFDMFCHTYHVETVTVIEKKHNIM